MLDPVAGLEEAWKQSWEQSDHVFMARSFHAVPASLRPRERASASRRSSSFKMGGREDGQRR